ncbi:MAG: hypothetical protein WD533_03115 [Dehalococcoidia bacterium]
MAHVLDRVGRLSLSDELTTRHANELNSLKILSEGLDFLYQKVKQVERHIQSQVDSTLYVEIMGNHPLLEDVPEGLVACAFHWYAVSVCNYVRLVGWLANEQDSKRARDYVQGVLPEISIWRNKVAAHFAITDPRNDDTPADLAMSTMSSLLLTYVDRRFWVGGWSLSLGQDGNSSTSRQGMSWSLTDTHERLVERYGP